MEIILKGPLAAITGCEMDNQHFPIAIAQKI